MKSFFVLSVTMHGALLAALIVVGTLLSKPRMSYYAVDLFSAPSGGGTVTGPAVSPISAPAPAPAAPKHIAMPKVSAPAPRAAEEELPDQDTIRMLAKLKKKRMGLIKSQPRAEASASQNSSESHESAASAQNAGRGGGGLPGSGSGIVADAGPAFPYPWYLKALADRLDKQWHPPQEFEADTLCQVTFVISRTGQISGSAISKSSGDSLFDQLSLRAVLYSNPLPPLPY
jgi:outer membrane biosynthesis protein TonB